MILQKLMMYWRVKTGKIKLLHKFILDSERDRNNTNRLRNFEGFQFKDMEERDTKISYFKKIFFTEWIDL